MKTKSTPTKVAIASCTPHATDAAAQVAMSGGNAFDAVVAGAFDLMVSNVLMCSIGGGGFATVKIPGEEPVTFDFFDAMPGIGVNKDEFGKNIIKAKLPYGIGIEVITGYSSIGIPGTSKGLELILKRFGNLDMKTALKPAIGHARQGVPLNATIAYWLSLSAEKIHWLTEKTNFNSKRRCPDRRLPNEKP
jgi:gamma-glutamyltranspeptidase/glutathione hydrolase